jgi:hypothetical protein
MQCEQKVMEVKLSVSSSRRISFASDLAYDDDLEIEELENRRDNPNRYPNRNRVFSYSYYDYSDDDDDEDKEENENYVNISEKNHQCDINYLQDLSTKILFDLRFMGLKVHILVMNIPIYFFHCRRVKTNRDE